MLFNVVKKKKVLQVDCKKNIKKQYVLRQHHFLTEIVYPIYLNKFALQFSPTSREQLKEV